MHGDGNARVTECEDRHDHEGHPGMHPLLESLEGGEGLASSEQGIAQDLARLTRSYLGAAVAPQPRERPFEHADEGSVAEPGRGRCQ